MICAGLIVSLHCGYVLDISLMRFVLYFWFAGWSCFFGYKSLAVTTSLGFDYDYH